MSLDCQLSWCGGLRANEVHSSKELAIVLLQQKRFHLSSRFSIPSSTQSPPEHRRSITVAKWYTERNKNLLSRFRNRGLWRCRTPRRQVYIDPTQFPVESVQTANTLLYITLIPLQFKPHRWSSNRRVNIGHRRLKNINFYGTITQEEYIDNIFSNAKPSRAVQEGEFSPILLSIWA